MKTTQKYRMVIIVLITTILILTQLACGTSTTKKLASALPPTAISEQKTEDEPKQASVNESTQEQPKEKEPTNTPKPTEIPATEKPKLQPINVIAQGYGQDEQQLGYSFIVENPNQGYAYESSQYQISAYDAAGTVVETNSSYIELILPGQKIGIGGDMYLDEGVTVAKIEVQLLPGDEEVTDLSTTFSVDKVTYSPSDYFSKATGVITNPYDRDIEDLRVSAVVYNEAGEIIGGGFTFLNFILAKGTTGVSVSVTSAGEVAKVELYPTVSSLSMLTSDEKMPDGAQSLTLAKQGFGQNDTQVGCGALVQNPNSNFAVENTKFHITLFAEDGHVISVEEGYIDTLLPNQILGVASETYVDKNVTVVSMDFQIKAGNFEGSDVIATFTATNISYKADTYFPKVTGEIQSPYTKDVTNLRVSAIAYNEAGDIIGGGYTYLDFVPANGKIAVEVTITTAGTPASIELYAAVSGLSDFK